MKRKADSVKKIALITIICCIVTGAAAVIQLVRSSGNVEGKSYERLEVEEARKYMSYEEKYTILDVRSHADYEKGHLDKAVNIPYDNLVKEAEKYISNLDETIYVYGNREEESSAAVRKLTNMGYTSAADIGSFSSWESELSQTETNSLMAVEIE